MQTIAGGLLMKEVNCMSDRDACNDYHEGLCMANLPGFPKKVSRLHRCPFNPNYEDVIK